MRDDRARPGHAPAPATAAPGTSSFSAHDPTAAPAPQAPPEGFPHPPPGPPPSAPHPPSRRARWAARWRDRRVRAGAIAGALALCGLAILLIVRAETGTEGFLIGLLLAVVPVPVLISAFRWLDGVEPTPWRSLCFTFAWGACAATLVAVVANTFATKWLTTSVITGPDADADFVGAVLVAPITEELAKVAAIMLLFLHRPRHFTGLLSGIVVAGVVATGFAFTENILYLGSAYGEDRADGLGTVSATATTFFVRILMSPFAHPLFTIMAGLGFGLAATRAPGQRLPRVLYPLLGLLAAIGLHALWNGTALHNGLYFLAAYGLLMAPLCGGLSWLALRQRNTLLRTVRTVAAQYAAQGWLTPAEAHGLGSMRIRRTAYDAARRERGSAAGRTLREYHRTVTALALLRSRAARMPTEEFTGREGALLERLLELRPLGSPYTTRAALPPRPVYYAPHPPYPGRPQPLPYPPYPPYRQPAAPRPPFAGPLPAHPQPARPQPSEGRPIDE